MRLAPRAKTLAFWAALSCILPADRVYSQQAILPTEIGWQQSPQRSFPLAPFSVERGEDLPKALLDRLAKRAGSYELLIDKFTCIEETRRNNKPVVSHDYLLSRSEDAAWFREIRFVGNRKVQGVNNAIPPPTTWSLLFGDNYQPHFVYRHVDHTLEGFRLVHRILFRGSRSFKNGKDIREWEGLATVDAGTHDVVSIRAMPRLYAEYTAVKQERRRQSLRIVVFGVLTFRGRRAPVVPYLQVGFESVNVSGNDPGDIGFAPTLEVARFPEAVRTERYRQDKEGNVLMIAYDVTRYLDYRFVSTDAETLRYWR